MTFNLRTYTAGFLLMLLSITAVASELAFNKTDMLAAQKAMQSQGKPLVLYVSHSTCPYCRRLEAEVMPAILNTQQYQQAITLQKMQWDSDKPVTWLKGEQMLPDDLVTQYRVIATPTILFLNARGEEIAKRIEGYRDADFYWVYFDRRIAEATQALAEGKK